MGRALGRGEGEEEKDNDLTLDDEAAAPLPELVDVTSGTFRPLNYENEGEPATDAFDAPAPVSSGASALSTFDGIDPNGTWQLWIMDNFDEDSGDLGAGWALQITADVDVQVPAPKKKKKGKGRR